MSDGLPYGSTAFSQVLRACTGDTFDLIYWRAQGNISFLRRCWRSGETGTARTHGIAGAEQKVERLYLLGEVHLPT